MSQNPKKEGEEERETIEGEKGIGTIEGEEERGTITETVAGACVCLCV